MKPRLRFRCEGNYCERWAPVHAQLRERVAGGRVATVELCDSHGARLVHVAGGSGWALHLRHLTS